MDDTHFEAIMYAFNNKETISIVPKSLIKDERVVTESTMRPSETGAIHIFVFNTTSRTIVSNILSTNVISCNNESLLPTLFQVSSNENLTKKKHVSASVQELPVPQYRSSGIVSITGADPLLVPQNAAPAMVHNFLYSFIFLTTYL
jgi:hypothetical protein